jgi:hypothetical protein
MVANCDKPPQTHLFFFISMLHGAGISTSIHPKKSPKCLVEYTKHGTYGGIILLLIPFFDGQILFVSPFLSPVLGEIPCLRAPNTFETVFGVGFYEQLHLPRGYLEH